MSEGERARPRPLVSEGWGRGSAGTSSLSPPAACRPSATRPPTFFYLVLHSAPTASCSPSDASLSSEDLVRNLDSESGSGHVSCSRRCQHVVAVARVRPARLTCSRSTCHLGEGKRNLECDLPLKSRECKREGKSAFGVETRPEEGVFARVCE